MRLEQKVYAGLAGLYAGDAFGLPMEMMPREHVSRVFGKVTGLLSLEAPISVDGYVYRPVTPRGRGSDDTYFNTYVIDQYIKSGCMNEKTTAEIFISKCREIMDTPFYGPSTLRAMQRICRGEDPKQTGLPSNPMEAQSCGAATLRSTPIGMANPGNVRQAAVEAAESAMATHGSSVALAAASAWAGAVAEAMSEDASVKNVYQAAIEGARIGSQYGVPGIGPSVEKRIALALKIAEKYKDPKKTADEYYDLIGAGLPAAETVPFSLAVFFACPHRQLEGILRAISTGGDTDSTGSMVGALIGVYSGHMDIKEEDIAVIERVNRIQIKEIANRFASWIRENRG